MAEARTNSEATQENSSSLNRPLIIFGIGAALAVAALLVSIHIAQLSILYFFGLLVMVASFVIGKNQSSTATVIRLAVVSLLVRWVLPIRFCSTAMNAPMRSMYAADYITQAGHVPLYYPVWQTQPYTFWPGSHILLSSIQQLTAGNIEAIHTFTVPLASTLGVVMFYFLVREITGQKSLAALSAIIIALFRPLVGSALNVSEDTIAFLCLFMAMYAVIAFAHLSVSRKLGLFVIAVLAVCGTLISHHHTGLLFLISLVPLVIVSLLGSQSRVNKISVAGYFAFCILAMATYWIVAAYPFFISIVHGTQTGLEQIASGGAAASGGYVFSEGTLPSWIPIPRSLLPWISYPPSRVGIAFFNPVFEAIGRISSTVFYITGICAFIGILFRHQHRRSMSPFLLWAFIVGLLYIVAATTPLGNSLDTGKCLIFAAYPAAVLVSFLALQAINVVPRVASSLVYGFVILIITIQGITAFSLDIYGLHRVETGSGPFVYAAQDRAVGQWAMDNTEDSTFFLADSRSSAVLLYSAHREASWDYRANDRVFRMNVEDYSEMEGLLHEPVPLRNIALSTTNQVYIDYVMLNVYNKVYGAYAVWGLYFSMGQYSVAANIDSMKNVNLVYNDGKSFIYRIHR